MNKKIRVYEKPDGSKIAIQHSQEEHDAYIAANPDYKVVR